MLAGFVVSRKEEASMEYHVVALGTGTKCLGAQKRTCQVSEDLLAIKPHPIFLAL